MIPRPVIIDCDPGQDDAVNLLLALSAPEALDVRGITAVAGNVPLALTQRNARLMCDIAGRHDVPVYAGCTRPLVNAPISAEKVHGQSGIDGVEIRTPQTPLQEQHAVDFLIDALRAADAASITLVPTGPLTNVAMAMVKEPEIVARIRRVVLMGGAMRQGGNHSPSAEFNILADPHAAYVVFRSGVPITAFGLDVTHQVLANRERVARIRALNNPVAGAVAGMLEYFSRYDTRKYGEDGAPLHDPCTIAWLLEPGIFRGKRCNIEVEIHSELSMGHTAVDFWRVSGREDNADWMHTADAFAFYELLCRHLARFGK